MTEELPVCTAHVGRRLRVLVTEPEDLADHVLPRHRLHVLVADLEQILVKVTHVEQPPDVERILDQLPYEIEAEDPEPDAPDARYLARALRDYNVRRLLAAWDLWIVDALRQERENNSHKPDISVGAR